MLIDLKNGGALLEEPKWQSSIVNSFDFSVIEECVSPHLSDLTGVY